MNQHGLHFEEMYDKYERLIYHFLLKRVKDHHLAEDITQDTFLKLFQSFDTMVNEHHVKCWLHRHANFCLIDHFRAEKQLDFYEDVPEPAVMYNFESDYLDMLAYEELETYVLNVLKAKNPRWYDIVMADLYGTMTMDELREKYGISANTLNNSRYHLRNWMKKQKKQLEIEFDGKHGNGERK